jgi:hypothetical protein
MERYMNVGFWDKPLQHPMIDVFERDRSITELWLTSLSSKRLLD